MEISFKTKDQPESRKFEYAMPDSLSGLIERFGEEAVTSAATGQFVISLQALARRHIEKSDSEIQELAAGWTPGERSSPVQRSPKERAAAAIGKLSAEERAELLRQLQG